MRKHTCTLSAAALLLGCACLAGCGRPEQNDAALAKSDAVIAEAEHNARELGDKAERGMAEARVAVADVATQAKQAGREAADSAGNKVADAMITSSINAELAKDKTLSASQIDVDTDGGRVALHGVAPSESARARATELASAVKGVVSVDNQLTIGRPNS